MTLRLFASQIDRLCDGTQACKRSYLDENGEWQVDRYGSQPSWTAVRRAEVVIDGEIVHEESAQASPFELWESVAIND